MTLHDSNKPKMVEESHCSLDDCWAEIVLKEKKKKMTSLLFHVYIEKCYFH